jgi:dihydroorotate dehydrogenase electron transfer subunit
MVKGDVHAWPYLRRPFSVYSSDGESEIEIVYRVVGRATEIMSRMAVGDALDVIGPLGKGFGVRDESSAVLALAGGIGVPPVAFFCQRHVGFFDRIVLIVGALTKRDLLVPVGLAVQGVDVRSYTEDGSKGAKGTVLTGFYDALGRTSEPPGASVHVIACGPRPMLAAVADACHQRYLTCDVCVEEVMACGVGACLACAVPASGGGYHHACQDGPVFESQAIDWARWGE